MTLIIGILSSMFTALFMTRYFFAGWVRNPEHKQLTMAQFLKETTFRLLGTCEKSRYHFADCHGDWNLFLH